MSTLGIGGSLSAPSPQPSGLGRVSLLSAVKARWEEYRLMRSVESVPFAVMKDLGYPAPETRDAH